MPEFMRMLSELREHMSAELTRSDVLRALIWPNAGLLLMLAAALSRGSADWIILTLFRFLAGFMALYAATYVFCLFKDRDALRSEKYKLQKMAIERGLYGDSTTGVLEQVNPQPGDTRRLEAPMEATGE